MAMEWAPDTPNQLSEREIQEYRIGRDAALEELGRKLGGAIAVIEL